MLFADVQLCSRFVQQHSAHKALNQCQWVEAATEAVEVVTEAVVVQEADPEATDGTAATTTLPEITVHYLITIDHRLRELLTLVHHRT